MSKAEERALEAYPLMSNDDKEGLEALKYIGMECECASVFNEVQEAKQIYFIEGYHQAEKDVAEAFAKIIRGNLRGIGNGIQNMFEQLYTEITGEKMYKGFKDQQYGKG